MSTSAVLRLRFIVHLSTALLGLSIALTACTDAPAPGEPTLTPTPRPRAPTPFPTETPRPAQVEPTETPTEEPTLPVGPQSGVVIVTPSADSYIDSVEADANFGTLEVLAVSPNLDDRDDSTPSPDNTEGERRILMRFDVTDIPDGASVIDARLRMFVQSPTYNPRYLYETSDNWDETSVTWNNAPMPSEQIAATFTSRITLHVWDQVRVGHIIRGNGSYNFYLIMDQPNDTLFRSREFAQRPPTLIIEWGYEMRVSNPPSPSVAGDPPVLVGAGDISDCGESNRDENTAQLIDRIPGLVFMLGDAVYDAGTVDEFFNCYEPTWGRFKDRTMPAVGDHEYNTPGAAGYYHYFGAAANDRGYYSYDVGAWHVVVLNSNCHEAGGCDAQSPQGEFLRTDLLAHPTKCLMAYWHEPRFSLRNEENKEQTEYFWQQLYEHGAELVMHGDEHYYARFAPQNAAGQADPNGIRQFIVGTGGRARYQFENELPNVEVKDNTSYGVLKLTLFTDHYDWEFIHVDVPLMEFSDSGSDVCH